VNWGGCCDGLDSTYNIRVGRSENVEGPYLDKRGKDMMKRKGSVVLRTRPRKNKRIVGPGHAGIFKKGSKEYFSFHFYDNDNEGMGTLGVYELKWNKKGWPRVNLKKPMIPSNTTCDE